MNFRNLLTQVKEEMDSLKVSIGELKTDLDAGVYIRNEAIEAYVDSMRRYQSWAQKLEEAGESLNLTISGRLSDILGEYDRESVKNIVCDYCKLTAEAADLKSELERTKLILLEKYTEKEAEEEYFNVYQMVVGHVKEKHDVPLTDEEYDYIEEKVSKKIARGVDSGRIDYDENADLGNYHIEEEPSEQSKSSEHEEKVPPKESEEVAVTEAATKTEEKKTENAPAGEETQKGNKPDHAAKETKKAAIKPEQHMGVSSRSILGGTVKLPGFEEFARNMKNGNLNHSPMQQTTETKTEKAVEDEPEEKELATIEVPLTEDAFKKKYKTQIGDLLKMGETFIENKIKVELEEKDLPEHFDGKIKNLQVRAYSERKAESFRESDFIRDCGEMKDPVREFYSLMVCQQLVLKEQVLNRGFYFNQIPNYVSMKKIQNAGYATEAQLSSDKINFSFYGFTERGASAVQSQQIMEMFKIATGKALAADDRRWDIYKAISAYNPTELLQSGILNEFACRMKEMIFINSFNSEGTYLTYSFNKEIDTIVVPAYCSSKDDLGKMLSMLMGMIALAANKDHFTEIYPFKVTIIVASERDMEYLKSLMENKLDLKAEDFGTRLNFVVRHDNTHYTIHSLHYTNENVFEFDSFAPLGSGLFMDEEDPITNGGKRCFVTHYGLKNQLIPVRKSLKNRRAMNETLLRKVMYETGDALFNLLKYVSWGNVIELGDFLDRLRWDYPSSFTEEDEKHFLESLQMLEEKGVIATYLHEDKTYICLTEAIRSVPMDDKLSSVMYYIISQANRRNAISPVYLMNGIMAQETMPLGKLERYAKAFRARDLVERALDENNIIDRDCVVGTWDANALYFRAEYWEKNRKECNTVFYIVPKEDLETEEFDWNVMPETCKLLVTADDLFDVPDGEAARNRVYCIANAHLYSWNGAWWDENTDYMAIENESEESSGEQDSGDPSALSAIKSEKQNNPQTIDGVSLAEKQETVLTQEKTAEKQAEARNIERVLSQMTLSEAANYAAEVSNGTKDKELFKSIFERTVASYKENELRNAVYEAFMLLRCLGEEDSSYRNDIERMAIAINSKSYPVQKTASRIENVMTGECLIASDPVIKLTGILQSLFAHNNPYDYALTNYARNILDNYDEYFADYKKVKPLLNLFCQIIDCLPSGFDKETIRKIKDNSTKDNYHAEIVNTAKQLIEVPKITSKLKRSFPVFLNICFGKDSELQEMMTAVANEDLGKKKQAEVFVNGFLRDTNAGGYDEESLEEYIDEMWSETLNSGFQGPPELEFEPRNKAKEQIRDRLDVLREWLKAKTDSDFEDKGTVLSLKAQILSEISTLQEYYAEEPESVGRGLLLFVMKQFKERLNGHVVTEEEENETFLTSRHFCLDSSGAPVFYAPEFAEIKNYEPWRNALEHIGEEKIQPEEVYEKITNPEEDGYFDNFGQRRLIAQWMIAHNKMKAAAWKNEQFSPEDMESAKAAVNDELKNFSSYLESEYAYGRITEATKELMIEELRQVIPMLEETSNYGSFRMIRNAMRHTAEQECEKLGERIETNFEQCKQLAKTDRQIKVLNHIAEKIEEKQFVIADEYMTRLMAGETPDETFFETPEKSAFEKFIENEYKGIYEICASNRSGSLRAFGLEYVNEKLDEFNASVQYRTSSRNLLNNIPNTPDEVKGRVDVKLLLQELGFDLEEPQPGTTGFRILTQSNQLIHAVVSMKPAAKELTEFSHPIDIFGTKMINPVDVIFLFGRLQANDIVDRICKLELNRTAIVIMNGALDLHKRRQVAEKYHRDASGNNPFLLVDWVLLLHLATFTRNDRLPVLLNCTLPFTASHQPFVKKGHVSDEMFIGRKAELRQIIDMNGPVVVYGGRQLGKSALLERAVSLTNRPRKKEFSVMIRAALIDTEDALVNEIISELSKFKLRLPDPEDCSMTKLCGYLKKNFDDKRIAKLWIFIDEADGMLASFRKYEKPYKPLIAMADLCTSSGNNFKFVLAGLHNVYQAANDPNTIFGQFGMPLCIEPLSPSDAMTLLTRPLSYLGFKINVDKIASMIVNTNFYPGIIHHVGYNIVENLLSHYGNYYQAINDNPPFELTEQQLGDIMSSNDLNSHISQLITWTLEADPCYLMLSRTIAYLYYEYPENNRRGYSIQQIQEYAQLLDMTEIAEKSYQDTENLLNEMIRMGILMSPANGRYRLRQRRILEAIGESREVIERRIRETEE